MSRTEFSLPCESNSSMNLYPNNTVSHFRVYMREPLELNNEWEVALSELQYPCAWDNVRRGSNKFLIRWRFQDASEDKRPHIIWKTVPSGYYADTESLVNKINELVKKQAVGQLKGVILEYDSVSRRVTLKTKDVLFTDLKGVDHKVYASIKLKGDIARLLGFPKDKLVASNREITSPFTASPTRGFHQMYLYSDIIQPQPHPDGNVPIFRVIAVEHGREEKRYASIHFQQPYFMSLSKSRIHTIEFKITDSTGKPVGFSHGNSVITLLFRKKGSF